MTRNRRQHDDAPGQDSFLDIVANLVGILIILIMVIGVRATDAMVEAGPSVQEAEGDPKTDVAAARAAAEAVENDVHEIDAKIKRQQFEIAYRRNERDKFLQMIGAVERHSNAQQRMLDKSQRQRLEMNRNLLVARGELEDLKATRHSLQNSMPPKNVIEHLPTPMAKTVFGREAHFRLKDGRVTFVPWNELVEKLKQEAPQILWKLKDAPQVTETLGPVRGFRMKYTLRHARQARPMGGGAVVTQTRVELDRFELIPVREDLGEPLESALHQDSEFHASLSRYDPERTTVTVWVYPDSFGQFRLLKHELFRLGFLTAGRPMPDGHPIGGSPHGSRSASQ
jgi:hypothetical protein